MTRCDIPVVHQPNRRSAFTLIELLVVVAILGILASTVVALVTSAGEDARKVAAKDSARVAAEAIMIYRGQTGQLPNLFNGVGIDWTPLTRPTIVDGRSVGPFLQSPAVNPLARHNPSCVTDGDAQSLSLTTCSFLYDYNGGAGTGRFIAALDP